jgi:hypothetical protein
MTLAGGSFSTIGVTADLTFVFGPTYTIPIEITSLEVATQHTVLKVTIGNRAYFARTPAATPPGCQLAARQHGQHGQRSIAARMSGVMSPD